MPDSNRGALGAAMPSAVDLTRLSARLSFPPGGEALYRSILRQAELTDTSEFVVVPCGRGRAARFIAETTGAGGAGADPDGEQVAVALDRAKRAGLSGRLHYEEAPPAELPYQDAVFDLAVGEMELGALEDVGPAAAELVRVTRPGGVVALVQLVWTESLEDARRSELVARLGIRPRMAVEWRQLLLEAGVSDVRVEDWSDRAGSPSRPSLLGGLTELFTLRGKLRILPRAWRRWGWRGVGAVLSRERDLRRLLQDEQVLGVALLWGRCPIVSTKGDEGEEHDE